MKRLLALLMVLVSVFCFTAHAEVNTQTEYKSGHYRYKLMLDGSAVITGYDDKNATTIVMPSDLDNHHISAIGSYAFENCKFSTFTISEFVSSI